MDWKEIERLRVPGFTIVRRGYDQREVDKLLGSLVDWLETDAAVQLGELTVQRKLDYVGKSTSRILQSAEKEALELRHRTDEECAALRNDAEVASIETRRAADDYSGKTHRTADEYSEKTRRGADEYSEKTRTKADRDAQQTRDAAAAKAKQNIEEGERRRAAIEAVISELEARRDNTIRQMDRLQAELGATIAAHRPGTRPTTGQRAENGAKGQSPAGETAVAGGPKAG